MRRSLLLLVTCLLALATGSALVYAAATVARPVAEVGLTNGQIDAAANEVVVQRFYDAVNHTLRTSDPAPLDGLVSADFVAHAARPGLPPSRTGLIEYLVGLGAAFPELRLTVVDLLSQGDEVMARVRVDGGERGSFLGVPLAGELAAWGSLDVFRIADGAIVEHWGSQDGAVLLRPLTKAAMTLPVADGASVMVQRVSYPPDSSITIQGGAHRRLLYLEAGTLRVEIDGVAFLDRAPARNGRRERPTTFINGTVDLRPGDLLVVSVASVHVARNDGPTAAISIDVTVTPNSRLTPMSDDAGTTTAVGGVTAGRLNIAAVAPSTESVTVAVGRAVLAPDARLPAHTATGVELFYVSDGVLGLSFAGANMSGGNGPDEAPRATTAETMFITGKAVILTPGSVGALRSAGDRPTSLVVMTVTTARPVVR